MSEQRTVSDCLQCIRCQIQGIKSVVDELTIKVDGISTELDLSELTALANDSNTRIQGMETDLSTTKGNTESLSTEVGEVMARATATYNNTQAILSYVKDINGALVVTCDECACDEPAADPTV